MFTTKSEIFNQRQEIQEFEQALVEEINDIKKEIIPAVSTELSSLRKARHEKTREHCSRKFFRIVEIVDHIQQFFKAKMWKLA